MPLTWNVPKRLTGLLVCPQWLPAELEVVLGITDSHHDK
jgi:hypothetical protein